MSLREDAERLQRFVDTTLIVHAFDWQERIAIAWSILRAGSVVVPEDNVERHEHARPSATDGTEE